LTKYGIAVEKIGKVSDKKPNILDAIKTGRISLIINTPVKKGPGSDDYLIRTLAVTMGVPYTTTISGAQAVVAAIEAVKKRGLDVKPLQEYYRRNVTLK
ncbi:MAG TPA: carbamoyl-phosphate synthase large chain, partial [Candidatus Goldiibacteriota bacterium]|nr:carbamoyl-phosphate synthase large chain [Candidatus Goldiibacteriota bacterium]